MTEARNNGEFGFSRAAVHDAKNLVAAIRIAVDQLKRESLPLHALEWVNSLACSSIELQHILSSALIEDPHSNPRTACDLGTILHSAATSLSAATRSKGLRTHIFIDGFDGRVLLDRNRVVRALLNLIDNAIKYSPAGTILITASVNKPVCNIGDKCLVSFGVMDNGFGLTREEQNSIARGVIPGDSITAATGERIGLASLAQWLSSVGGTLIAHNRADAAGAYFGITIPAEMAQAFPPAFAEEMSIVLVSNDEHLGDSLKALFKSGTYCGREQRVASRSVDEYFLAAFGSDCPRVLLVDVDSDCGKALVAGGVLGAPDGRQAICLAILRNPQANAAEDWARKGFNGTLSIQRLEEQLPFVLAQQVLFANDSRRMPDLEARRTDVLRGKRVLIVDDNREHLRLCELLATNAGADCVLSSDGDHALMLLKSPGSNFDTVLLDYYLPNRTAAEILTALETEFLDSAFDPPWVILMSADTITPAMIAGVEDKVGGLLQKPLQAKEFYSLLSCKARPPAGATPIAERFGDMDMPQGLGDVVKDIQAAILIHLPNDVLAIYERMNASDESGVIALTHNLKSSAYLAGYTSLARLCDYRDRVSVGLETPETWFTAFTSEVDRILLLPT